MGRIDDALAAYDEALERNPASTFALVNRGLILGRQNRLEEAAQSFERAVELDNRLPAAYLGLGKAQLGLRHPSEAVASFERVVELDPGRAEAYGWLARAQLVATDIEAAESALEHGLSINPEHPLLLQLYGQMLAGQERFDEAIRHFRKAVASSGEYAEPRPDALHHTLATALLASGQLDEGVRALQRTLELNPNHALAHNDLGLVYENTGELDKALEHYERAVELGFETASAGAERVRAKR